MGAVIEWAETLEFKAESPDGTVRSRICGRNPIQVKLDPIRYKQHSENSLAKQIESAVSEVLKANLEAVDRRRFGDRDPGEMAKDGDRFARCQLDFREAVAAVSADGVSRNRYVNVNRSGIADIQILIETGSMNRLSRSQMTSEINSGIEAAERSRSLKAFRLSEKVFGPIPYPPYKGRIK